MNLHDIPNDQTEYALVARWMDQNYGRGHGTWQLRRRTGPDANRYPFEYRNRPGTDWARATQYDYNRWLERTKAWNAR